VRTTLLVTSVAVAVFGCARTRPVETPAPETPTIWKRYTTPDGSCSAEFPDEPRDVEGRLETVPIGHSYCLLCSDVSTELEALTDEGLFESLREMIISNGENDPAQQNEITAERKVVVDGCVGREWQFSWGKDCLGRGTVRALIRDGKLYRIIAITVFGVTAHVSHHGSSHSVITSITPDQQDREVKRFIDSFRFEKPKP
jgi:hypothetical protein